VTATNSFNKALGLGGPGTTSGAPGNFVEITDAMRKTNDSAFKFDPSALKAAQTAGAGIGSSYIEAIKNAITSGVPEMRKATDSLLAAVRTQAAKQGAGSGIVTTIALDNSRLLRLAGERKGIADQLDKANQALQDITSKRDQFRQSTLDTALGSGALTGFVGQNGVGSSFARISGGLRRAVANMRRLIADVNKLRAEGLAPSLLQQIVAAGPDAGLEAAQALLQKGAGGIGEVNKLQGQLEALSTSFANQNTKQFFSVGVAAAQGIVNGLQSREDLIEAEMQRIAAIMEAAIRKSLGIRSPSRVMRDLFAHVPEGAALGIRDGSGLVAAAVADMTAVPSRVPSPTLAAPAGRVFQQTNHISVAAAPGERADQSLPRAMRNDAYAKGYAVV
ncbi:MAG TPA: hypothetical protein VFH80_19050, partial [Solirubrobacteraceae bacterium]|nr:hypothetical protein [Solirubrobacteraceae bacterium]